MVERDSLRRAIDSALAEIEARAGEAEQGGTVHPATIAQLRKVGLYRCFTPDRYGGAERDLFSTFEALAVLGEGCAATAWVSSLFVAHSLIVAWFSADAQSEVWSQGPDTLIASSLAPMHSAGEVPEGIELSGCWSFVSGIDHADWILVGAKRGGEDVLALLPADSASILEDWDVVGLQASGSKSIRLDSVFVPEHRVLSMERVNAADPPGLASNRSDLFRVPWRPFFSFTMVPPALGVARAAVKHARSYLAERQSAFTGKSYASKPLSHVRLAESVGEVQSAGRLMKLELVELSEVAALEAGVDSGLMARASFTPGLIVELCHRAVTRLFTSGGGKVLYRSDPLARCFRDMTAIAHHPGVQFDLACENYGQALYSQPDLSLRLE